MNNLFSKPFALSIGPQACGAEILHDYFKRHPDVALPKVQEIFFFDRHVHRGSDFYKNHFEDSEKVKLFMEITTTAFDHPHAPQRVKELFGGDIKLFCPLRDPVERAVAVYKHYLRYGIVKGDIREACEQAPQILFASRYTDHLENWVREFSNIHFLSFNGLQDQSDITLRDLCAFLDVPFVIPKKAFQFPKIFLPLHGKGNQKSVLSQQETLWLNEQLKGETGRLNALIGDFNISY